MSKQIEYRVRPVTRYVVTRFYRESMPNGNEQGGCEGCGEFDNMQRANTVAEALHKSEDGSTFAKLIDPGFEHGALVGPFSAQVDQFPLRRT